MRLSGLIGLLFTFFLTSFVRQPGARVSWLLIRSDCNAAVLLARVPEATTDGSDRKQRPKWLALLPLRGSRSPLIPLLVLFVSAP